MTSVVEPCVPATLACGSRAALAKIFARLVGSSGELDALRAAARGEAAARAMQAAIRRGAMGGADHTNNASAMSRSILPAAVLAASRSCWAAAATTASPHRPPDLRMDSNEYRVVPQKSCQAGRMKFDVATRPGATHNLSIRPRGTDGRP